MSAFVKCKINGPQMHYIVALAWKVFISCAHVWTKQEDRLKAAGRLFQMAAAETVKFLAPMVVLDHRTNYSFMVSADCRCCRPAASEAGTQSFSGFIVTSVCLGGVYAIRSVCLPFCLCAELLQKSNDPISLQLGVMTGPTSRKNWITFVVDPVPDTATGSLFHFAHHCGVGDFRRFINISHAVTGWFSGQSAKWLMPTR